MHQLDAGDRYRGISEPFETEHHVCYGLDVSMGLLYHIVQVLRGADRHAFKQAGHLPPSPAPRGARQRNHRA